MFTTSEKFPEGWFFIKNMSNGYVLMVENASEASGTPIVLSSLRTKDSDAQLWRYDEEGRLHNKKTNLVMDVAKGNAKAGTDIVQQATANDNNNFQQFGLSSDGHIYLKQKSSLVLGIKESFFSRREGLHVHLQLVDKRHLDRKEQRWDFVLPIIKTVTPSTTASASSLKRSTSTSSVGSASSGKPPVSRDVSQIKEDDARSIRSSTSTTSSLDQDDSRIPAGTFPDTAFFLKSQANGFYIGAEAGAVSKPGTRMTIDSLRKTAYDSQLWTFDAATNRIINKHSGFILAVEGNTLKDDVYVYQVSASDKSSKYNSWTLSAEGEICLQSDPSWVLGFKDSWFGMNREGAHLHLQKKTKGNQHQRFSVVLPIFKKRTTESTTTVEQHGVFPEGWFFVKSQAHGLVLTVLNSGVLAAEAVAVKLDTANYSRQLWKYQDGYLINKASEMVLDVKGGSITPGAEVCQYKKKKKDNGNQQWALTVEGFIHIKARKALVLAVEENASTKSKVFLSDKKSSEYKAQRWNFVLPVFKKKQATREVVSRSTVKKTISYQYAQYPAGWFFIRSLVSGSTKESPLVLAASKEDKSIHLTELSRENWQTQLWAYHHGVLINYETQLALDVSVIVLNWQPLLALSLIAISAGSAIVQAEKQERPTSQHWYFSVDGYLVHAFEPSLNLVTESNAEKKHRLTLATHQSLKKEEHRWILLTPTFGYKQRAQALLYWSNAVISEWRASGQQAIQKTVARTAAWPEETFFIGAQEGYALVPEKSEAFSAVVVKKIELERIEVYKWAFRNGYLVHVATGLVLHASDSLAHGSALVLRGELTTDNKHADDRQLWTVQTDGSIVSEASSHLGLHLIQKGENWIVQLSDIKQITSHYSWRLLYGKYERRFCEKEKKERDFVIGFQRIVLTMITTRKSTANRKLVTHRYGVFPDNWFFIRSKDDSSLIVTVSDAKEGAKLKLAKLDFKIFRRQLWQYRDDGCLANMESDYVIDVAGGKLMPGCDVIQYHEKFLRRSRKNQQWGLSVDGHIHPQSRPGLVLSPKGNQVKEGIDLQISARGQLSNTYQQWTFASPVFGKRNQRSITSSIQRNDSDLFVDGVGDATLQVTSGERYERVTKRTIIRRWAIFPAGGFFIRVAYGNDSLALTVEKNPKPGRSGHDEYEVTLRALNFKEYKWQFWTFEEGHLINKQTGLALDAEIVKDLLVEDGLKTQLYVRQRSVSETQYWALSANGEIHLRSNERLVIGISNEQRASVSGAQVGLRELRVKKTNENGREEITLQSEQWMRWSFSKPVFGKRTVAAETEAEIEDCEEQKLTIQEQDESCDEESSTDEEESAEEPEEEDDDEVEAEELEAVLGDDLESDIKQTSEKVAEVKKSESTASTTSSINSSASAKVVTSVKKSNSTKSLRLGRKDSFQLADGYIPTGFEKVVRYKTHPNSFPAGYFLIKSHLHGFVLDVQGDATNGAQVILTRIKTTDFASQLWSYRDGFLVNLKGQTLVLDAAEDDIIAGERVHLSPQRPLGEQADDQQWEYTPEGVILLSAKRSLVLSVKELRRSDKYDHLDVFVQEEKVHRNQKDARREQRWEILIPALIPVSQKETGARIIEAGKVGTVTSSVSAVLAFKWLKETFHHKITSANQWPSSEKWFFIRYGNEDRFLAAGQDSTEVGLYDLSESQDYKRFLWIYIDGYLVNYKYKLRLTLNQSLQWVLSNSQESLDQTFGISVHGVLTIRIKMTIYYLRITRHTSGNFLLEASTEETTKDTQGLQLHVPVFSDQQSQIDARSTIDTISEWIHNQRTTTVKTIQKVRRALFPSASWFFLKVADQQNDELVLAVQGDSTTAGARLIIRKISFTNFKSQLWTFRDGLLINYGSKLVIDVHGNIGESSHLIQSTEAGVSTQKWELTVDGHILLESHDNLFLGYKDVLNEGTEVILTNATVQVIRWKFSVPVFGKKTTTTAVVESITQAIEQGATLEKTEDTKIQEVSHTQHTEAEHGHGIKEVMKGAGTVVAAGAAAAVAVGAISKVAEAIHHSDVHKIHKIDDVQAPETQLSVTKDIHSATYSITVIEESRMIIRMWRVMFIRRISQCKTQKELVATIEETRRILTERLDQHLKAYGSESVVQVSQKPAWYLSVVQMKEHLNTHLFETYLGKLKTYNSDQQVSIQEIDIEKTLETVTHHVDSQLEEVIISETKKSSTAVTKVQDKAPVVNHGQRVIVTVQTIQVIVRYWFIDLYQQISAASQNNATDEEIHHIITIARKELDEQLTRVQTSTAKIATGIPAKNVAIEQSVVAAIKRTQEIVNNKLDVVRKERTFADQTKWLQVTKETEESVNVEVHQCQTRLGNTISEVQIEELEVTGQTEVVKTAEKAQQIVKTVSKATVFEDVEIIVAEWYRRLTIHVAHRIKQGGNNVSQDVDAIIAEAKVELAVTIEQTKKATVTADAKSQKTLHDTLFCIRSSAWNHTSQIKKIASEISTKSSEEVEKLLKEVSVTGRQQTAAVVEKCKNTVEIAAIVGTVAKVGYDKHASTTKDITKAHVAIFVEDTKSSVSRWFARLTSRVGERVRKGGDNVTSDVEYIIKEAREEISLIITESKNAVDSKFSIQGKSNDDILVLQEAHKNIEVTLVQVQESVLAQVAEVQEIAKVSTVTDISEKLAAITEATTTQIGTVLTKSEVAVTEHLDVVVDTKHTSGTEHDEQHQLTKDSHKHTAEKVLAGAAVVAAGAAIVHEVTKKHDDVKKTE
ncbi:hypothetical protein EC973_005100, partial [Apophysomyces ossiformis]